MKSILSTASVSALLLLSSCASIIAGSTDKIQVMPQGTPTANCELRNVEGYWSFTAPGTTEVKKSKTNLDVECQDPQTGAKGQTTLASGLEGWTFGNILLGGLIGVGVDWATGSLWEYPSQATVTMIPPATPATPPVPEASPSPILPSSPTAPAEAR